MAKPETFTRRRRFSAAVLLPIAVTLIGTLTFVALVVRYAAGTVDAIALERQTLLVERAVSDGIKAINREQESVTVWDEAIQRLRGLDLDWLDSNLGVWLYSYFHIDRVFILDDKNRPVYAMMGGRRADPGYFNAHLSTVLPVVDRLRSAVRIAAAGSSETPRWREVVVIDNRPALVGVVPVVSDTGRISQRPGTEYVHVAVRFLDGGFLTTVIRNSLASSARFSWTGKVGENEGSFALRTSGGTPVGWVAWTTDRPGHALIAQTAPFLIAAAAILTLLVLVMARRLHRTSTELEASEAQAQHLAFHDPLTGLPNRALFANRLEHALARVRRGEEQIALLYLDLDRFKYVNDTYGHPAGDELIREVASRLKAILRTTDTVARLGGDEFAIIQSDCGGEDTVETVCDRIQAALAEPFEILGHEAFVGCSIGVALAPEAGTDASELVRKADIALYRAKADGRAGTEMFVEAMDQTIQRRQVIETELRRAIDGGQLELHYQPLFAADGETITAVEALVRWNHPEQGLLSPAAFVPIAEECGLIHALGEWVLQRACRDGTEMADIAIAVNVSAIQVRSAAFPALVARVLGETGLEPWRLELEITESVLLDDHDRAVETIKALHGLGVKVALDDFGTGYSSLTYLRLFSVDKIKIDRSFVKNLSDEEGAASIVTAIVGLGRALGMQVTAEGVETRDQLDFLARTGCHEVQGYYFARPMPLEAVKAAAGRRAPAAARRRTPAKRPHVA